MEKIFITDIRIDKVRHLNNITIPVSDGSMKHLILTGKNGSGKTSLLDAVSIFLNSITTTTDPEESIKYLEMAKENLKNTEKRQTIDEVEIEKSKQSVSYYKDRIEKSTSGIWLKMNKSFFDIRKQFESGQFVVAYYKADRKFFSVEPQHVEKVILKAGYQINETPRQDFVKYLLDLKVTQALAAAQGNRDKAEHINQWFVNFNALLKKIFEDDSVQLHFDEDTYKFTITMQGREPFDFNTLSSGYAAILDIVVDIIVRMENQTNRTFDFSIPGIVLIDEIETHLHLELQRDIMELLTTIFPNIQFIVSTHSPFILNSLDNVVIYDLEKHTMVKNGLSDVPYSGIVEGYFRADELSNELREKFNRYTELANKPELSDPDYDEIAELELYLDEIPDYLALKISTEYQEQKQKLRSREDH